MLNLLRIYYVLLNVVIIKDNEVFVRLGIMVLGSKMRVFIVVFVNWLLFFNKVFVEYLFYINK